MNNYYLLNEAIDLTDFDVFKEGMQELNAIIRENDDTFWKHDSLWNLNIFNALFSNFGQEEQAICQFIEQILSKDGDYLNSEENLSVAFPNDANAFLGIDFSNLEIREPIQVKNVESFFIFKSISLDALTFREIWDQREKLFPHLILCGQVEVRGSIQIVA